MYYDEIHEKKFIEFCKKDETRKGDVERISMFYLLALNESTRANINSIYDFKEHQINPECLDDSWQTGSSTRITRFAFNLYNGYKEEVDILNIFAYIDYDKIPCLFMAINLRLGIEKIQGAKNE